MFKHVHTLTGTRYRSAEIKACVNELLINNVGLGSAFSIWHFLKKNYVPFRRELYTASSFEGRFGNASSVTGYLKHD